jgi:tetratricopeptide (TPR) repeat protein
MFISLRIPDDPSWRADPAYSCDVAAVLISGYKRLHAGNQSTDTYAAVLPGLLAAHGKTMAPIQRQHLSYILAHCWSALYEFPDAIRYLDDALALSATLDDTPGIAECAYLRGSTNFIRLALGDASLDHLLCLQALREARDSINTGDHPLPASRPDPSLELYALLGRATAEVLLAHNDVAAHLLDEAARFVNLAPHPQREAATLTWRRALILRWSGAPGRALPLAIEAAQLLALDGSPEHLGRIHGVIADIALDLADLFADLQPDVTARDAHLRLAATSIDRSLALARVSDDPAGEGLALLSLARLRRLAGQHRARLSLIEDVARTARRRYDPALLGQSYIAMGHELASRGHPDQARNRFTAARQLLEDTDLRAIDVLAERALHNLHYTAGS